MVLTGRAEKLRRFDRFNAAKAAINETTLKAPASMPRVLTWKYPILKEDSKTDNGSPWDGNARPSGDVNGWGAKAPLVARGSEDPDARSGSLYVVS